MSRDDPLAGLPRLGADALGPCVMCNRLMLETFPLFYRAKIQRCGIDRTEVTRHVGLAAAIAPGRDGLALAAVMGPTPKPVVVTDDFDTVNVCVDCAGRTPFETIMLAAMAKQEDEECSMPNQ